MTKPERFICDHCGKDRMNFFLMDFNELVEDPRSDKVNLCMVCFGLPYLPARWRLWLDEKFGTPYDHNDYFL